MQVRAQKIILLNAVAVRGRFRTSVKSQEEIAENYLCSDLQIRNRTSRIRRSLFLAMRTRGQSGL